MFLIGHQPANPVETVVERRNQSKYNWYGTRLEEPVFWDKEAEKLARMKIPVHSFYFDKRAKENFEKISSITKGTSQELNVFDNKIMI